MSKETREKVQGVSVWWREDRTRWYADYRSFASQGGGREVLRDPEDVPLDTPPKEDGEVPVTVERAVARRLGVLEGREKRPERQGRSDPTLLDYSARWLNHREADLAEATFRSYESRVGTLLDVLGGDTRLSKIGSSEVLDYITRRRGDGVTNASIQTELAVLENMYSLAVIEDAPPPQPGLPDPSPFQPG